MNGKASRRPSLPDGPWLVAGLGSSGLSAGRALIAAGADVIGVDSAHPDVGEPGFEVELDSDGLDRLGAAAAVVKSPGIPPHTPVVAAAHAAGLPVLGELELAWRMSRNPVVAVTGTNGKTTVTEWIGHALHAAGRPAFVAGNVGTPYSSRLDVVPEAIAVIECSSFQLADTIAFRPEVGVLLNLGSDHLDWHGTVEAYRAAKLNGMFSRQTAEDVAIAPAAVTLPGDAARVALDDIVPPAAPSLPGAHNAENAKAVVAACGALGVEAPVLAEALRSFAGVEHRLEDLGLHDGVRYINDSKATNVASTLVALEAMDAPVHLILGGDDAKQEDFTPLREPVLKRCQSVQLIGDAAPRLRAALQTGNEAGTLDEAVRAARSAARGGDVVLLSPACASYDQYRDFVQRGNHFKELAGERRTNA